MLKAVILLLLIWHVLSLFNGRYVIPPISLVFENVLMILASPDCIKDIFITLYRLGIAMVISVAGGLFFGAVFSIIVPAKATVKEALKMLQVVPPVSVLIMAIMWFGLNGIPAIFIVVISLIPLITIYIMDAIDNIDKGLLEMAKCFKFSKFSLLINIYFPAIRPAFYSALTVGLTMAAKIVVMAEVLSTNTGIGGRISTARLNIEPELVIAWTIITIVLYYIIESAINAIKRRQEYYNANHSK